MLQVQPHEQCRELCRDGDRLLRMYRRLQFLSASLSLAVFAAARAHEGKDVIAEVRRYLRAILFGDTLQGGIRTANARKGQSSPFLDRVLAGSGSLFQLRKKYAQ